MQTIIKMFWDGKQYKNITYRSRKEAAELMTRETTMIPVHKRDRIYFEVMSICNHRAKPTV